MLNSHLCFQWVLKDPPINLLVSADVEAVEKAGGKHQCPWNIYLQFRNWAETSLLKDAPLHTAQKFGQMSLMNCITSTPPYGLKETMIR